MPEFIPPAYVPQVQPYDYVGGMRNAMAMRAAAGQMQDADYQRQSRQMYNNALAQGMSPDQAVATMRQQGFGSSADQYAAQQQGLTKNALAIQGQRATQADAMDQFIRSRVPLVKSQQDWDTVKQEAGARFGFDPGNLSPILSRWSPDLGRALALGGLTAAQQLSEQYRQNTAQALGVPQGVDPAAYLQGQHAQQQMAQSAELQPGRVDLQKAQASWYGARQGQAAQPKTIMVEQPDPNDWTGKRKLKVPMLYQQGEDGTLSLVPVPQAGQQGASPPGDQTSPAGQAQPKPLDAATAKAFLDQAGGDRNKAREMARAAGYTF